MHQRRRQPTTRWDRHEEIFLSLCVCVCACVSACVSFVSGQLVNWRDPVNYAAGIRRKWRRVAWHNLRANTRMPSKLSATLGRAVLMVARFGVSARQRLELLQEKADAKRREACSLLESEKESSPLRLQVDGGTATAAASTASRSRRGCYGSSSRHEVAAIQTVSPEPGRHT